jgi:hypothetical protein
MDTMDEIRAMLRAPSPDLRAGRAAFMAVFVLKPWYGIIMRKLYGTDCPAPARGV